MSETQTQNTGAKIGEQMREVGSTLKGAARERMESLRGSAGEYYQMGKEKALEAEEQAESFIREKPIAAILIAAGLGLICGALLVRRQ